MATKTEKFEELKSYFKQMRNYAEVLSLQVKDSRNQIKQAIEAVTNEIKSLVSISEIQSDMTNNSIVDWYINADKSKDKIVENAQKSVTQIFESASRDAGITKDIKVKKLDFELTQQDISNVREVAAFSKNIESIARTDDQIKEHIMTIIGHLSVEDVVSQRLTHVEMTLTKIMSIIDDHISDDDQNYVPSICAEMSHLGDYMYKIYKSEEEKKVFLNIMSKYRKVS